MAKPKGKGLGAPLNTEDNRDIAFAAVARALNIDKATHPKKNITDISMLTVEDQKDKGTCVGQAEGKDAEFQNFLETGKVVQLSKRGLYKLCKLQDGLDAQGTYPRIAANIRVSTGIPREALIKDDNTLPYEKYMQVEITNEIKTSASEFRSKGYSFVTTLEELKTAIDVTKAFNATLFVGDFNNVPVKPLDKNGQYDGTHRIWVIGYEDVEEDGRTRTKVYFLNSWGIKWAKAKKSADRKWLEKGVGWFYFDEFAPLYFRDAIVYLDMPNEIIDFAKKQQFIFPRQLDKGMRGTDVMELQKRLNTEIAQDGDPCFRYKERGEYVFTTYFGTETEKAVQRYQAVKRIVNYGDPKSTGYGRVGKLTLAALNSTQQPGKASQLELWADAIQSFEGWFTPGTNGYPNGSKSFRNNNPGNIKYIGQKRAIGKDSTGFCIFATYEDGRAELIDLLTRAATGKSSIYRPDMTLLQFYEKYAPSSDNNHPLSYASAVAKMIGCSITSKIKDIYAGTAAADTEAGEDATIPNMNNISQSALKIVLLFLIALLGLTTAFSVVWDVTHGGYSDITKILLGSFTAAITLVLGYYFGSPNSNGEDNGGVAGRGK